MPHLGGHLEHSPSLGVSVRCLSKSEECWGRTGHPEHPLCCTTAAHLSLHPQEMHSACEGFKPRGWRVAAGLKGFPGVCACSAHGPWFVLGRQLWVLLAARLPTRRKAHCSPNPSNRHQPSSRAPFLLPQLLSLHQMSGTLREREEHIPDSEPGVSLWRFPVWVSPDSADPQLP